MEEAAYFVNPSSIPSYEVAATGDFTPFLRGLALEIQLYNQAFRQCNKHNHIWARA